MAWDINGITTSDRDLLNHDLGIQNQKKWLMKSLMHKSLLRFALCVAALFILAAPMFYYLTKNFYAEELIDMMQAAERGQQLTSLDLEQDIVAGMMLQYGLIAVVVGIAIVIGMQLISRRLWTPFNNTLKAIENFRLEKANIPTLSDGNIREFAQLNRSLNELMANSLNSYRVQKEFTENASHELQTPLAIFQSKLELLIQQPDISEQQSEIIGELQHTVRRLSRLNRDLLLLAKIENKQFVTDSIIDIVAIVRRTLTSLDAIMDSNTIEVLYAVDELKINGNETLVESMVSNLVINAIRHNAAGGKIVVYVSMRQLMISNSAEGDALDPTQIFRRFYRPSSQAKGNGLGLAIVKRVADYHGWTASYSFEDNRHIFAIDFHPYSN